MFLSAAGGLVMACGSVAGVRSFFLLNSLKDILQGLRPASHRPNTKQKGYLPKDTVFRTVCMITLLRCVFDISGTSPSRLAFFLTPQ